MDDLFDNWTLQVRKGILELCILTLLSREEMYGYELVKAVVSQPGLQVAEGSIYPLLSRLKKQSFVESYLKESDSGPARKYYKITNSGEIQAKAMQSYFSSLVGGYEALLNNTNNNDKI